MLVLRVYTFLLLLQQPDLTPGIIKQGFQLTYIFLHPVFIRCLDFLLVLDLQDLGVETLNLLIELKELSVLLV